ncbi:MAG: hypothetical protein CM15mP105_1750 [Methanobacteriota archaeon]|nr:MAG: hypothetical protein CM15mP105_1750 [Euryarchaeota archaeon]
MQKPVTLNGLNQRTIRVDLDGDGEYDRGGRGKTSNSRHRDDFFLHTDWERPAGITI